jgi:hypothetical protein
LAACHLRCSFGVQHRGIEYRQRSHGLQLRGRVRQIGAAEDNTLTDEMIG